jgi:hypothetical protein
MSVEKSFLLTPSLTLTKGLLHLRGFQIPGKGFLNSAELI